MYIFPRSKVNIIFSLLVISSACLALVISTRSGVNAASSQIKLSTKSGPPSTLVKISGTSFGISETVNINFDTASLATTTTDNTGAFATQITIPGSALPGDHTIQVLGQTNGLSAQATFLVQTNWTMAGFNSRSTRFNTYENVLTSSNVSGLTNDWSTATAGPSHSSPAVSNGIVYVGAGVSLYAVDAQSGTSLWTYSTSGIIASSPTIANGVVYFGSADDNLYALNAKTGMLIWTYTTGSYIFSSPTVVNGVVYVGSYDHNLYALNAKAGTFLWSAPTGDSIYYSSPAVDNGEVFIASGYLNASGYKLYAFNATTGTLLWSYATGNNNIFNSPAVANGKVYFGSGDGNLYAFNAKSGKVLWTYAAGSGFTSSPAVANGVVYIGTRDFDLYAINATTGAILWTSSAGSTVESSPSIANGVIFIGTENSNSLLAFHLPGITP